MTRTWRGKLFWSALGVAIGALAYTTARRRREGATRSKARAVTGGRARAGINRNGGGYGSKIAILKIAANTYKVLTDTAGRALRARI
ncbi:MAG TPA: hypothetical protein GXX29_08990 [Firmicutes bacterium]|nr:hypothetical protein [Bacillota bacterium]